MLRKITSVMLALLTCHVLIAQPAPVQSKTFIHVDQFGYRPGFKKVAIISNPIIGFNAADEFIPSTGVNMYQLRRVSDKAVVFAGTAVAWNGGQLDSTSGDRAWWFDFSSFSTPGDYYVYDAGKKVSSFKFKIGDNVYNDVLKTAVRMFYYNRCNAEKKATNAGANYADGASFVGPGQDKNARSVFDKNNASTEKDLSGGWWDAGDFNKYVTFARRPVNVLLTTYRANPSIWKDDYNIPESGNGIPDIIDEIKWEMDWLKKMQLPDGSSLVKVGNAWGDFNGTTFPSQDTRKRYYYPGGCSGATISNACVFAHGALVFRNIPALASYSNDLRLRAVQAWNNFKSRTQLDFDCDARDDAGFANGTVIQAGDADGDIATEGQQRDIQFMSAVHLFAIGGEQEYKNFVDTRYDQTVLFRNSFEEIPSDYLDALIAYAFLPDATPAVAAAIKAKLAERGQTQDYLQFSKGIDKDAYRAYMPDFVYNFGGNQTRAAVAALSSSLAFYNIDPVNKQDYVLKAEEVLHYFHGKNPLSKVYLSNMYGFGAGNSVNEFYHSWFTEGSDWDVALVSAKGGPPPGYLVGGPNPNYRNPSYIGKPLCGPGEPAPCNQPAQKSYIDFNDENGNNESFQITEPAIYYQAAYIQLLSSFVGNASQPPTPDSGIGLKATYFNNITLSGSPVFTTNQEVNFDWLAGGPGNGVNNDNFSVRWEGELEAPVTGNYSFNTVSDDGIRLWVNDSVVVDNFTDHATTRDFGRTSVPLQAGKKYPIKIEYYEKTGNAIAQLYWTRPDRSGFEIVPKNKLFPANNTNIIVRAQSIGSAFADLRVEIMDGSNATGGTVLQNKTIANVSKTMTDYSVTFSGSIGASRVRVRFVNDKPGLDLKVDYIKIGSLVYQTEDAGTYSVGYWNQAKGCANSGFLKVDQLYCNGYFHYQAGANSPSEPAITQRIEENNAVRSMVIYPNPASKTAQLSLYTQKAQIVTVTITDISGRQVKTIRYSAGIGENVVSVELPDRAGTYFVQLIKDGKTEVQKLMVK
jgi:endoglucanase